MIDQRIPHNLLIAEDGMTIYVIPRKHDMLIDKIEFLSSFETVCGFVKFTKEAGYQGCSMDSVKA